ncbi:MAG: glutamine--fructose-6-phosphate transaminase (isomerizing) [Proteobacteria bacterium]|nr:glutamine--fructose-6-phosphate transaminase (isomerizing) [Pseudomonadota bacterium]
MCGIIGYIGNKECSRILLQGLRRLEYRGYDSAGIAINAEDEFFIGKEVGRVQQLADALPEHIPNGTGIAHTRWATHGGVTQANAHPHLSQDSQIVLVHNGIIENASFLQDKLQAAGTEFRSETDSETLVQLISHYYAGKGPFGDGDSPETKEKPIEAVKAALQIVRGTWGIAVMFKDRPDTIIAARNGSPLVVGLSQGATYLASDPHALSAFTRQVIFLNDGDIAELQQNDVQIVQNDGRSADSNIEYLEEEWASGELGDFPHFMLKEIHEQPEALRQCLSGRLLPEEGRAKLGGLELDPKDLLNISRVVFLGCGTAYHASQVGAVALEGVARIPSTAEISSEFRHRNPVVDADSLFFAVTQSGETIDTLGAIQEVKIKGGQVAGIVNVVGSSIARLCGRGVYIHSGPEMAVASTKAFSNMVAASYLFTLQAARTRTLDQPRGKRLAEELLRIPDLVEEYLSQPGDIDTIVRWVCESKMAFFLGRGLSAPVAAEGALKLMEVSYIPSFAYPSGEMKHGPIALLEEGSPVIVIAPDDSLKEKTLSNLQECRARGARIALIHTEGDPIASEGDISIAVPKSHALYSPLLTVLPTQLLAYKAGLALDRDVDRPRNLAKSVTVE